MSLQPEVHSLTELETRGDFVLHLLTIHSLFTFCGTTFSSKLRGLYEMGEIDRYLWLQSIIHAASESLPTIANPVVSFSASWTFSLSSTAMLSTLHTGDRRLITDSNSVEGRKPVLPTSTKVRRPRPSTWSVEGQVLHFCTGQGQTQVQALTLLAQTTPILSQKRI